MCQNISNQESTSNSVISKDEAMEVNGNGESTNLENKESKISMSWAESVNFQHLDKRGTEDEKDNKSENSASIIVLFEGEEEILEGPFQVENA